MGGGIRGAALETLKRGAKGALHTLGHLAFGLYGAWAWVLGPRTPQSGGPIPAGEVRRILVIRLDLLGDVVFSLPAIEALVGGFPSARVDLLVLPYTAAIARRVPGVGMMHQLDVNRYRRPRGWRHVFSLVSTIWALRRQRYDLAVGLSGLMGGVFAVLSGARWRIGYEGETYRGCYNIAVPGRRYGRPQHEVEYCLDLVRTLGVDAPSGVPHLDRGLGARGWGTRDREQGIGDRGQGPGDRRVYDWPPTPDPRPPRWAPTPSPQPLAPYAVLVPGASNGTAKRWPAPFWSELGDRLARERGLAIVISGAASERPLADAVAQGMAASPVNMAGRTSIDDLIDLLADAAVVIAGDTGPLHLAAALGRPAVGIYGPTDPTSSGPLARASAMVRLGLACSPCYDLRSPADCKLPDRSMPCMWGLPPDRVFEAASRLLDQQGIGDRG